MSIRSWHQTWNIFPLPKGASSSSFPYPVIISFALSSTSFSKLSRYTCVVCSVSWPRPSEIIAVGMPFKNGSGRIGQFDGKLLTGFLPRIFDPSVADIGSPEVCNVDQVHSPGIETEHKHVPGIFQWGSSSSHHRMLNRAQILSIRR